MNASSEEVIESLFTVADYHDGRADLILAERAERELLVSRVVLDQQDRTVVGHA
jgi:hypothetical protein